MELVVMVDALRRASAGRITAVIPTLAMRAGTVASVPLVYQSLRKWLQTSSPASVLTVC